MPRFIIFVKELREVITKFEIEAADISSAEEICERQESYMFGDKFGRNRIKEYYITYHLRTIAYSTNKLNYNDKVEDDVNFPNFMR